MSVKLNTNIPSLAAQRQLSRTTTQLNGIYERLSSGQRINRASDDAAGLAIADGLRASNKIYTQVLRNVADGTSALSVAEGALRELADVVTRQKELAQQAANGTYGLSQRKALNLEADALTSEFNRIVQSTTFNGQRLINGSTNSISIQVGVGASDAITISGSNLFGQNIANGTFTASAVPGHIVQARGVELVDLNNDGILDVFEAPFGTDGVTMLGNGDGTFGAVKTFVAGTPQAGQRGIVLQDFNNDGRIDAAIADGVDNTISIFFGNGDGSFQARVTYQIALTATSSNIAIAGDINGDGKVDIIGDRGVLIGNGDGTFSIRQNVLTASAAHAAGDINGDGLTDVFDGTSTYFRVSISNGDGTFSLGASIAHGFSNHGAFRSADFNRDGLADLAISEYQDQVRVFLSNGDGTFRLASDLGVPLNTYNIETVDFNGDGFVDIVGQTFLNGGDGGATSIWYGNGDGTFKNYTTQVGTGYESYSAAIKDINGDGALDIYHGGNGNNLLLSNATKSYTTSYLNMLSQSGAREALDTTQKTLNRVLDQLGAVGASQSRLHSTHNVTASRVENQTIAESRIRDVDVAEEVAVLVRTQILQQATTAILAQANQQPELVLRLIIKDTT